MLGLMYAFVEANTPGWVGPDDVLFDEGWQVYAGVEVTLRRGALTLQNVVEVRGETKACVKAIEDSLRACGLGAVGHEKLGNRETLKYPYRHSLCPRQSPEEVGRIIDALIRSQPRPHRVYHTHIHGGMGHMIHAYERLPHLMFLACSVGKPEDVLSPPKRTRSPEDLLDMFWRGITTRAIDELRIAISCSTGVENVLSDTLDGSVIRSWEG